MPQKGKFGVALIQHHVTSDKEQNVEHIVKLIEEAVRKYPATKFVCLPECFNSPYVENLFDIYAEYIPDGFTSKRLSETSEKLKIYIIGGLPERDPNYQEVLYNTATVWDPNGKLIAKHRKVHLYDVDLPDVHKFSESNVFTPGNSITVFPAEGLKCGITICHDIYYEEFFKLYRKHEIDIMFWPAAFHPSLGHHWDLMIRARANDNQIYLVALSATRNKNNGYESWGCSSIVDPWGRILAQANSCNEEILYQLIDFDQIGPMRKQIPSWNKRRTDLYG